MAVPGKNTQLLTTSLVTQEALMQFENNLVVANKIDWSWGKLIGKKVGKVGDKVSIRLPFANSVRRNTMTYNAATPVDRVVLLTVTESFGSDMSFSDADMSLQVDDFYNRYLSEGIGILVAQFDAYVYSTIVNDVANTVGQYSIDFTADTATRAKALLLNMSCPSDDKVFGILTPDLNRKLGNQQASLYNSSKAITKLYETGFMMDWNGVKWSTSQSAPTHEDGTWTGVASTTVTLTNTDTWAETTTVSVNGFTAGATLKVGDVFTLSGVNAVNPLTKQNLGFLKQFVVTTEVTSATAAAQAVTFGPALVTSGAYQNVNMASTSSKLISYSTSGTQGQEGIVFHQTAIGGASPELIIPNGTNKASNETSDITNLNLRYISDFDILNGVFVNRLDSFAGIKVLNRDWVVRLRG